MKELGHVVLWIGALVITVILLAVVTLINKPTEISAAVRTVTDVIGLTTTVYGAMYGVKVVSGLGIKDDPTDGYIVAQTVGTAAPIVAGILLLLVQ